MKSDARTATPNEIEWVDHFFSTDATGFCESCPHFSRQREPHGEYTCGCLLLERDDALNAHLCPALKGEVA